MKEKRRLSLYREAKGYSQIEIAEKISSQLAHGKLVGQYLNLTK